jgi:hypothetical protein
MGMKKYSNYLLAGISCVEANDFDFYPNFLREN